MMEKLAFRDYVLNIAKAHDTPVGDFIHDAKADTILPQTAAEIFSYIGRVGCWGASEAAKSCFRNYKNYCKSHNLESETL